MFLLQQRLFVLNSKMSNRAYILVTLGAPLGPSTSSFLTSDHESY